MNRYACLLILTAAVIASTAQVPKDQPDWLTSGIDESVRPSEDFFNYVNGGAFRRGDQGPIAIMAANNEVRQRERKLAEKLASTEAHPEHEAELVGNFWFTGMNSEARNRQGLAPLRPYLETIERIRSVRDLMKVVATLNLSSRPDTVLLKGWIWRDEIDNSRWVYNLSQGGGRTMENPSLYSAADPEAERMRAVFRSYMAKTFERLGGDAEMALTRAQAVFELEAQLTKAETSDSQRLTVEQLQKLSPEIDWRSYLTQLGVRNTDSVVVSNGSYFQALGKLMGSVSLSVWKDYLRIRLMRINAPYLDDRAFADFFELDRNFSGAQRPADLPVRVTGHMERRLGQPIARLFWAEYRPQNDADRFRALADALRISFRNRIEESDWLSPATKLKAIDKLDRMRLTIGFPDKLDPFRSLRLKRDSYVLNVLRANEWLNREEIRKAGRRVDRSEVFLGWGMRGDGAYDHTNNELFLPATYFPSISGQPELEDAVLYGTIGWMLAHEMAHGFDSRGRTFDAAGRRSDWWSSEDAARFAERTNLLVDQFNRLSPAPGVRLNGTRTLAENMSDLSGVLIALDAFKLTHQFRAGVDVNGFTPVQRFFLAIARRQAPQPPQLVTAMAQFGDHSPDHERVNGTLMNVDEFYKAFSVKPGDAMYLQESKRTRIW